MGLAVPDLLLLCKASRMLEEPLKGLELVDGRAKPVSGRPDCDTGLMLLSKEPELEKLFEGCRTKVQIYQRHVE
jgi:hypothetical protein